MFQNLGKSSAIEDNSVVLNETFNATFSQPQSFANMRNFSPIPEEPEIVKDDTINEEVQAINAVRRQVRILSN